MTRPPLAPERPFLVASPCGDRVDPFHWIRDDERADPEVLALLGAENDYADAVLAPVRELEERLYAEIVGRIREDDESVPVLDHGYWYWTRYVTGGNYPVYLRRRDAPGAPEETLLDGNALAAGLDYFAIGSLDVSPDDRLLAWTVDRVGRRQYELRLLDLATGRELGPPIANVDPGVAWTADSGSLLYVEKDPQTLLGCRVRRHLLGTEASSDALVYEEPDDSFYLEVDTSKSREYLFIDSQSTVASELRCARADDPALAFRVLEPRAPDHEYEVDHAGGRFVIRSNWQARNFRLLQADPASPGGREHWRELLPHDEDVLIEGFDAFDRHLVVSERSAGLHRLRVLEHDTGRSWPVPADEAVYTMDLDENPDPASRRLRYTCESLATPLTTWEVDLLDGGRRMLKRQPVLGDFDPARYEARLLHAPARDGESVPVAVVSRRGLPRDGTAPLLIYGYGAYGLSSDPVFRSSVLSLLDRGFVYAIAQVRGGQELGRRWYEAGRRLAKHHSFEDFIDATDFLVREGWAAADRVCASGGSAGGLLVAAVANLAPERYRAVVAHVPFVDVVTTMLDETLPLTTNEYDEWGDPGDPEAYAAMLAWSPYDNVRPQAYPAFYVTTGLWDSQVQYWEPVKWVQKLRRATRTDRPVLLRARLEAGHGGRSGRYERYRELAEEYAFMLAELDASAAGRDPARPASTPPAPRPA